jgi:hypothetical protein
MSTSRSASTPHRVRRCSNGFRPSSPCHSNRHVTRSSLTDRSTLIAEDQAFKVDLFVLGDGLLDRNQLERRIRVSVPGASIGIWVTSAEDQVLRKLDWYRQGGSTSDRQWRDVVGILLVRGRDLDFEYLTETAHQLDLSEALGRAMTDADSSG